MIQALLLDLGNVVLEVDFRRTFRHWSRAAGVPVEQLHERWQLDAAYRAHETGELAFEEYIAALGARLGIDMPMADWLQGWNDLFVAPFPGVQRRLAEVDMPLYAFTNTNPTHEIEWRRRYPQALTHFEEIYVSSTIGLRKPDRLAYEHVAEIMGYAPEEILFLDDTRENIDGAVAAQLNVEWIRSEADVIRTLERFQESR